MMIEFKPLQIIGLLLLIMAVVIPIGISILGTTANNNMFCGLPIITFLIGTAFLGAGGFFRGYL